MKSESEYKTEFVHALRRRDGWYAIRMEDRYAVGRPDILIGIPFGPTVLIEAKIIRGPSFRPEARQWIELERFVEANIFESGPEETRMSWVLGFDGGLMYLHTAAESVKVSHCVMSLPNEFPHEFVMRFWKYVRQS